MSSVKISVKVIANAKENKITQEGNLFKIKVTKVAEGGKANEAVIAMVAEFFKVKKRNVRIVSGERSNNKVIMID